MSTYSIKDLEHLSGVKAHTIRIWEQRYRLFNPSRTNTNIRYYSDRDLKLLLNIALLRDNGYKISRIATMRMEEMQKEVADITEWSLGSNEQISALTVAMMEMDEQRFEKVMANNILKKGFEETMIQIIFPFLERIGVLWVTGSIVPAQEHFMSNLIRQKVITAIDGQFDKVKEGAAKFVLFLPEGELHEISLLFADYQIRSRGGQSIYLGQTVPLEDLEVVCRIHEPEYVLTVLTSSGYEDIGLYLKHVARSISAAKLIVTGFQVVEGNVAIPPAAEVLHDFNGINKYLLNK